MRNELCSYGLEDITKCIKCNSECTFNKNPNPKQNLELINEYKRLMNLYNAVKNK
jgi:hypothetical protein